MQNNWNPEEDGITHINVYSKSKVWIGKFLSNFTRSFQPILTDDGPFMTIEGYWYWLGCKDNRLRECTGWEAKKLGRELGAKDWLDDEVFKTKIKKAIRYKINTAGTKTYNEFIESSLPFTHYYVYGGKVVDVPQGKWIIDYIEELRREFKGEK